MERSELERALAEHQRDWIESLQEWQRVLDELHEEKRARAEALNALLVAAREAGMRNGEIAAALNVGVDSWEADREQEPGELAWPQDRWTVQAVTAQMRDAESDIKHAIHRLTDLRPPSDE